MSNVRDELIRKVECGELSPVEAEAEAARLKLKPLAYRPEPDDYNPMKEASWSLPMAVAWIAYRSPDDVREWWNAYRKKCEEWRFLECRDRSGGLRFGHFLLSWSEATLDQLRRAERNPPLPRSDPNFSMTVEDAIKALWAALRSSRFEATGKPHLSGRRVSIPPAEWDDLDVELKFVKRTDRGTVVAYHDVLVPMKSVCELWPARPSRETQLPALMKPEGAGFMSLYCAAQWIATKGGQVDFHPANQTFWQPAYNELLGRIASDEMKVVGVRNGLRETVPGVQFAGCRINYPFSDAPLDPLPSDDLLLYSNPCIDVTLGHQRSNDLLWDRRGDHWGRLLVREADVLRHWPFGSQPPRSGAPGRPSSMHLVKAEFKRRVERGEVERSVAEQARVLEFWLKQNHPTSPPLKAKAIENGIRDDHRLHKPTPPKL